MLGLHFPHLKRRGWGHLCGSVVGRLPLAQVVIPGSWDQVSHQPPYREPASPSPYVSAFLSLCLSRINQSINLELHYIFLFLSYLSECVMISHLNIFHFFEGCIEITNSGNIGENNLKWEGRIDVFCKLSILFGLASVHLLGQQDYGLLFWFYLYSSALKSVINV